MVSVFSQRDTPLIIRKGLREMLPDYRFLSRTSPNDPDLDPFTKPYVTVIGAGTPSAGTVTASENIHITVYAGYEPDARDLANLIDGLLLSPDVNWGFAIEPGPGLVTAPDAVTGGFVASTTVVAASPKTERILS